MDKSEWKSLGNTKQFEYVNRLEEINRQKQELIERIERSKFTITKVLKCKDGYNEELEILGVHPLDDGVHVIVQ